MPQPKRRKLSEREISARPSSSASTASYEHVTTTGPVRTDERVDVSDTTGTEIEASSPLSPPPSEVESESVDAEHDPVYGQHPDNPHKPNTGCEFYSQATHDIPPSMMSCHEGDDSIMNEVTVLQVHQLPDSKRLEDLQFLDGYKLIGENQSCCIMMRGHIGHDEVCWIPESDVHRTNEALLNTFWESREDGHGRPNKEIPEQVLRIRRETKLGFRVQMVGAPLFNLKLLRFLDSHKKVWEHRFDHRPCYKTREDLERYWPGCFNDPTMSIGSIPTEHGLVMIFSHCVNQQGRTPYFEFFCFWRHKKGSWKPEATVQKWNSPAVVTYWHSSTEGIREKESRYYGIPVQYLKILKHRREGSGIFLTVQLVGKSQSKDDVEELEAGELMKRWKGPTTKYLKINKLQA